MTPRREGRKEKRRKKKEEKKCDETNGWKQVVVTCEFGPSPCGIKQNFEVVKRIRRARERKKRKNRKDR